MNSGLKSYRSGLRSSDRGQQRDDLDESPPRLSSRLVKTTLALELEAKLERLSAAGSTPTLITISMEDWLDIANRAKDKTRGDAIAGYTFSGVEVRIARHQLFPEIEAKAVGSGDAR